MSDDKHNSSMLKLNKVEIALGVVVAIISIWNAYATMAVLPYRVAEAEKQMRELRSEVQSIQSDSMDQRELLIRIDERLKTVQAALKLPSQ